MLDLSNAELLRYVLTEDDAKAIVETLASRGIEARIDMHVGWGILGAFQPQTRVYVSRTDLVAAQAHLASIGC